MHNVVWPTTTHKCQSYWIRQKFAFASMLWLLVFLAIFDANSVEAESADAETMTLKAASQNTQATAAALKGKLVFAHVVSGVRSHNICNLLPSHKIIVIL